MSPLDTHDTSVGDYTVHLHEAGLPSGPPVLWLHGSGPGVSALSNWERLITDLLPRFRNIAPDIVGFGESTHPENPPRGMRAFTELRADFLLELLDTLGVAKAHLVGNSMGGMIGLRMAQKAPDRLERLVLMGSGGAPIEPTEPLVRMMSFYDDPSPAAMRKLLEEFTYDATAFGGDLDTIASDRLDTARRQDVQRSHQATFDPNAGPPVSFPVDELAAIRHETLVVHGREDQVIPVEASHYLVTHLPNAELLVLPHAGHWIQIDQARRFAARAQVFLERGW